MFGVGSGLLVPERIPSTKALFSSETLRIGYRQVEGAERIAGDVDEHGVAAVVGDAVVSAGCRCNYVDMTAAEEETAGDRRGGADEHLPAGGGLWAE